MTTDPNYLALLGAIATAKSALAIAEASTANYQNLLSAIATMKTAIAAAETAALLLVPVAPPVVVPPVVVPPVVTAPAQLRGLNLAGCEGGYGFSQANGPIANTDYPVHPNGTIDYYFNAGARVLRFLFSWERVQSALLAPIPAASGNYRAFFDNYKQTVDHATSLGMTVIMEPWQASASGDTGGACYRGAVVGGGTVTNAHFADFWGKMAAAFKDNPLVEIGLCNEPNNTSTMQWFAAAQAAITAIRAAGFTGRIHVPGNGWTNAEGWNSTWYDTAATKRSNAYGWLNANGLGRPLSDPLNKLVVEVHAYADGNSGGGGTDVVSGTISRERVKPTVDWARANGLTVHLGEIGMYANATNAQANWSDFIAFCNANLDVLKGFTWWACGKRGWWDDVAASGGGHFSVTPNASDTSGNTVNMTMIKPALAAGHA